MKSPKSRCLTSSPRKLRLPHKRNTAEMATQNCCSMKTMLPGTTWGNRSPNVSHSA